MKHSIKISNRDLELIEAEGGDDGLFEATARYLDKRLVLPPGISMANLDKEKVMRDALVAFFRLPASGSAPFLVARCYIDGFLAVSNYVGVPFSVSYPEIDHLVSS